MIYCRKCKIKEPGGIDVWCSSCNKSKDWVNAGKYDSYTYPIVLFFVLFFGLITIVSIT